MTTPEEVCEAFVDESGWPKPVPVSRRQISAWMASPSLEVRGALFHFLRERAEISRVETPFTPEELFPFITGYFEHCLAAPEEVATIQNGFLEAPISLMRSLIGQVTFGNSREVPAEGGVVLYRGFGQCYYVFHSIGDC